MSSNLACSSSESDELRGYETQSRPGPWRAGMLELVAEDPSLLMITQPILRVRRALIELDRLCRQLARQGCVCHRLMTVPESPNRRRRLPSESEPAGLRSDPEASSRE